MDPDYAGTRELAHLEWNDNRGEVEMSPGPCLGFLGNLFNMVLSTHSLCRLIGKLLGSFSKFQVIQYFWTCGHQQTQDPLAVRGSMFQPTSLFVPLIFTLWTVLSNQATFGQIKQLHIFREEQCSNVHSGSWLGETLPLLPTCERVFFFDIWACFFCLWCFPHCPFCLLTEAKRTEPQLITLRSNNTGYCNRSLSENTEFFLGPRLPGTA